MLDVARIAYIENIEKEKGFDKEIIYAAALVHDIGRSPLYSNGLPHEEAGVAIAGRILNQAGFSDEESFLVAEAILAHRNPETRNDAGLSGLIYRADKKSRLCLFCDARAECNWSREKMNMKIDI